MGQKQPNPLAGCFIMAVGSLLMIILLLLFVKGCCSSFLRVDLLAKRLAGVYTVILFWVVVFFFLSGKEK